MTFHWDSRNKGKNIKLSGGGRTATRVRGHDRDFGVVITEERLRLGQKIRFKLDQVDRILRHYGGLVRVLLILLNWFFENGSKF